MAVVSSVCCYCGTGCGVLIETDAGHITSVRGDPDHPSNRGRLCTKGTTLALAAKTGGRALYPELRENRQVARAVLAGVAGAANVYSASQAGHGSYTTPSGRTGTFYSPTAAVIAQNNAAVQNEAMFAATIETGQRNMAALEQTVIKDNTLMPGEWYGGQLHIAPPTDQPGGQKSYTIVITVGQDRHVVDVNQGPAGT